MFHRYGEVMDWLCRTGRMDCGWDEGYMNLTAVAIYLEVKPVTVNLWRRTRAFPLPDKYLHLTPLWRPESVDAWPGRPSSAGGRPRKDHEVEV